jgi:hypothetical protein
LQQPFNSIASSRLRRNGWIVFVLTLLCSFRLLAIDVPPPGGGGDTNSGVMLDSWSFADTNYWTSDLGFYPISYSNICVSSLGPGNSLDVDSTNASWLEFNVWEATGATNLNVVSDGSAMFWFSPNWASTSDTNDVGTGPGVFGRLLEIGEFTTNASYGWWSLYMDNAGNNLYFTAQDENGDQLNYLSAPVTFTSNLWYLIALSWTSTNTSLYVDGACLTNGPGISVLPNTDVISNGFTIGSDAATGMLQMHGAINSLKTYNFPLDANTISAEWVLDGIFYLHDPGTLGNFTNAPYSPGVSQIYDVVSGQGYLNVIGTNTTTCFTNSNVWITNVATTPGTNGSVNMSFMVIGGNPDLPYDVFGIGILPKPLTNGNWTWLGQAYPCETNVIYGLTNRDVYLILGTPLSFDGDGFTVAFDTLLLHINPYDPDVGGDGIANGFKLLAGLPLTTPVTAPSLNSVSVPCCPIQ